MQGCKVGTSGGLSVRAASRARRPQKVTRAAARSSVQRPRVLLWHAAIPQEECRAIWEQSRRYARCCAGLLQHAHCCAGTCLLMRSCQLGRQTLREGHNRGGGAMARWLEGGCTQSRSVNRLHSKPTGSQQLGVWVEGTGPWVEGTGPWVEGELCHSGGVCATQGGEERI